MSESIAAAGMGAGSVSPVAKHPNASVALGSGSGLGAVVVWAVGLSGVVMPPEVGAVIGGLVAATALFIGRSGIKGAWHLLLNGEQSPRRGRVNR
jgi:hypothetical protein